MSYVRALALTGLAGTVYLGLTILILHFEPTGYSPVSQLVSDYAVGAFATEMSVGFFAGGFGVAALALAIALGEDGGRMVKVGALLLMVGGLALFSVGAFPTDVEGAVSTLHGGIHDLLSQVAFSLGPLGMVLVSYEYGLKLFRTTALSLIITWAFFAADGILALNASGLAERFFILVLLGWWGLVSYRIFMKPPEPWA